MASEILIHSLERLAHQGCCLLPCGSNKNPLIKSWPSASGLSVQEILQFPGIQAIGLRLGPSDARMFCIDLDGQSAIEKLQKHGLNPDPDTWIIARTGNPHRKKIAYRLSSSQLSDLGSNPSFQDKIHTKDAADGAKGEAIELFFSRNRQIVIAGRHPDGDKYVWPDGRGVDALRAPDDLEWQFIKECHSRALQSPQRQHRADHSQRSNTRRANPCPVCGRHDGPGGSNLWCEYNQSGLLFCMPGTTFAAPAGLRVGDVVSGWALKKITQTPDGPVHVFGEHDPEKLKRQNHA